MIKNWVYNGTLVQSCSEREQVHGKLARELAAEGIVLMKNEGLLPLKPSVKIALFGSGADKTVKGGTGSGDVNNRENISVYRGLKEAGVWIVNEDWILDYQKRYQDARRVWKEKVLEDAEGVENPFDAYARNPFLLPKGRRIMEKDMAGAEAAVYVLSRISGEGKDRRREEGDYYFSQREWEDIDYLDKRKIPIVLILNVGAPVELTDLLQKMENIKAVLNISLPGQEGGRAAADILLGKAVPSGKLTATWAKRYKDYPSAENYGYLNGNLQKEEYLEGIYVGYRYFDSFGIVPLFPFGYGLSYTSFSIAFKGVQLVEEGIEIGVSVENTGTDYAGKEVVQVYLTPPQTGEAKEYHRLIGFAKTDLLQPKEVQELTIFIEQKQLASFFESSCEWVIENGLYGLWIGNSIVSLQLAALLKVTETVVLERTKEICLKQEKLEELGAAEFAKSKEKEWTAFAKKEKTPVISFVPRVLNISEKEKGENSKIVREQEAEQFIPFLYGKVTEGSSMLGSAGIRVPGSAGETTDLVDEKGEKRSLIMADGPAGLRLRQSYEVDRKTGKVYGVSVLGALENGFLEETEQHKDADTYYQYCTAFPVGTALAQTWDIEMMHRFGEAIAVEMEEFHIGLWLAPGMNIHRNPLCGRNFEYYSEDPLLTGKMAAAVTEGVQKSGACGVTIKHFACNNQEDNRMSVDVCVSQRALREIYFRGFEIAVKKSRPAAIMSSYNCINGVHAANSYDICTEVARKEWGFEGVILSDWNTTVPEDGSVPWKCIAAGNDIIMPGNLKDDEDIRRAYAEGKLSKEAIQSCAERVIAARSEEHTSELQSQR